MIICDYLDDNVKNYLNGNKSSRTILTFFKEPFDNYKGNKVIFIDDILDNDDYQKIDIFTKNITDILSKSLKINGYNLFKYLKLRITIELCKIYKYKYAIDKVSKIVNIYSFICFTCETELLEWLKNNYKIIIFYPPSKRFKFKRYIKEKIKSFNIVWNIQSFFFHDSRKNVYNLLWMGMGSTNSLLPEELKKDFKFFLLENDLNRKVCFFKRRKKFNVLRLQSQENYICTWHKIESEYDKTLDKIAFKMGVKSNQANMLLKNLKIKLKYLFDVLYILEENIKNLDLLLVAHSLNGEMGLAVDFFKKHKLPTIEVIHGVPGAFEHNKNIGKIAVNGKRDKIFYTNHGVNSQKVVVTGCPRYDKFFHIREEQKKYNHLLLILDWIAFTSSSRTSMDIFRQVMCMLRLIEQLNKVKLIIKLHPLQTESELMYVRSLVFKNNYYKEYVEVVKNSDTNELLKTASIVFTHSSSVGLEALLMKKPVIILDIFPGFKLIYRGHNGFLIVKDFDELLMLTRKVLKDIDEYLRSNSKNIKKTIEYFYNDSKGESYKRVANLARNCANEYKRRVF